MARQARTGATKVAQKANTSAKAVDTATETSTRRRSGRNVKDEVDDVPEVKKEEDDTPKKAPKRSAAVSASSTTDNTRRSKRVKTEETAADIGLLSPSDSETKSVLSESEEEKPTKRQKKAIKATTGDEKTKKKSTAGGLQAKKLKSYTQFASKSPFPDFPHPTAEECKLAHKILASLHGERTRPKEVIASTSRAGCGDSPTVLDALVRTILSQNTSDKNSTRAKLSMDKVYGGSDRWDAIVAGGQPKLQEAIKSGGLSVTKSKVIISILEQAQAKYGKYSLDHLFQASDEEAMREMLSFQGVGPKTASCVLLFCLQRESFAVDTHVWRITGLLGWRPKTASRDETYAHLDVMIPDEHKYALHILLVSHGKRCDECKAGGKNTGKCELRRAFRKGKIEGEAGEEVKNEELNKVKDEQADEDY